MSNVLKSFGMMIFVMVVSLDFFCIFWDGCFLGVLFRWRFQERPWLRRRGN